MTGEENTGVVLSVGEADGVREGDVFWIWRREKTSSGQTATARAGKIRIVRILGHHSSLGEVFYGTAETGDEVQRVMEGQP